MTKSSVIDLHTSIMEVKWSLFDSSTFGEIIQKCRYRIVFFFRSFYP